jgi:MinD superfamily P-loop ATPase
LGTWVNEDIELVGDSLESFYQPVFDVKREPLKTFIPGGVVGFLRSTIVSKPCIETEKCKKCGVCVQMCPVDPKAVNWHDGIKTKVPTYKYKSCIRCYCCQELCPEGAIVLKAPLLRRMFSKKKK